MPATEASVYLRLRRGLAQDNSDTPRTVRSYQQLTAAVAGSAHPAASDTLSLALQESGLARQSRASQASTREKNVQPPKSARWCRAGLAIYFAYILTSIFYFSLRVAHVTQLPFHRWYCSLVLLAELTGACAMLLYGLCLVKVPLQPAAKQNEVLVPCYSEALDIVAETVRAAHQAALPEGCSSTVWLLDDGCDGAKKSWVESTGHSNIRYISGRRRPTGEVNGKAGNLNNLLKRLFPRASSPPQNHVVAIFDCDQVCHHTFFMETLPLLHDDDNIAMVITPQRFGNVLPAADIFNHANRHFWEVMVPGLTAWGMVVCTGSNLIIRANALQEVGFFPADTITEDFALGLELAKRKYRAVYLGKYLAQGEAPEEGATFRQRSRWCKGHLQAFMSRDCPLLQSDLPILLRVLYFSGTWSYLAAALCTPVFTLVPFIAVVFQIYPASLDPTLVCAFIPYFISMHAVMYYCKSLDLLRALWFSSCATHILWYTYLKAIWNTSLYALGLKGKGRFKTTVKTGVNTSAVETAEPNPGSLQSFDADNDSCYGAADSQLIPCHRSTASAPSLSFPITPRRLLKLSLPGLSLVTDSASGQQEGVFPFSTRSARDSKELKSPRMSLQRTLTVPALQRHLSLGSRPGWNLQVAPSLDGQKLIAESASSSPTAAKPVKFDQLTVTNISFGVLRDTWVPLLSLLISCWTVVAGLGDAWSEGPRQAATVVTVLWALYNCVGPYLLIHYTWIGRCKSLEKASAVSMLLVAAVLVAAATAVWVFAPAAYDYKEALRLSYYFFEAQRSGRLPAANRIAFRGDSALTDSAPNGAPLAGGWYDAGDHLKASFPTAVAASLLAWGLLEFPKGHATAKQIEIGRENLRWGADYLIACHISPLEFVGQVGSARIDHAFWGRPEDMDEAGMERPAYLINASHPGSDVVAQAAAALAASSKVFEAIDSAFSSLALRHAEQLYQFAVLHPGLYAASIPELGEIYPSTSWRDDAAWAAAWLYVATSDAQYLAKSQFWLSESRIHEEHRWQYYVFNWDNMIWSTNALLSSRASAPESTAALSTFLDGWRLGKVVDYTARGLAFSDEWGTLRNAVNAAVLALVHAKTLPAEEALRYECWALSQIRYVVGDAGRSFVVGFGKNPPLRPHHRAASCPPRPALCNETALHSPLSNPHVLKGALVGGPDAFDRYADDRTDYKASEVGVEYNAGFTAALAAVAEAQAWPVCLQLGLSVE